MGLLDPKVKTESEKTTEKYLITRVERLGGLCWKWVSPGTRGVPDRVCVLPGPIIFFVECKSEGEEPNTNQALRIKDLRNCNAKVYVADTKKAVDKILEEVLNDKATAKSTI